MFGFVTADMKALDKPQQERYRAVYCGICRAIRERASGAARLGLSYDMAFLALLLMSLYEPEEQAGKRACGFHPLRPRAWIGNACIDYCADMNVALAYYKALDDRQDEGSVSARLLSDIFGKQMDAIRKRWPRQCKAILESVQALATLEAENCPDPDRCAAAFGDLMAQLLVYREDMWAPTLQKMGQDLGRFIYLADAAVDYPEDAKKHKYNPFLAQGTGEDWGRWEQYLLLYMARCTAQFEKLPLVQDKPLLDSILYSGVWGQFRNAQHKREKKQEETHDR